MSAKSSLETYFSSTKNAQSTDIPWWRKKTLSFEEALVQLKRSTGSSTECVAYRTLGRCRKQIKLIDSHHAFIARLNDGNITEEKTAVSLIDLMLCPEHWAQTVFHFSLYLNWLNSHGPKPNKKYYENIVVDYEAARAIEDRTTCLPEDTSVVEDAEVVDTPSVSSLETAEWATTPSNERSNNPSPGVSKLTGHGLSISSDLERVRSASELREPASLPPSFGSNQIEKFDFSFCSVLPLREGSKSNLPVTFGKFPIIRCNCL
jgi:hypothetical protein